MEHCRGLGAVTKGIWGVIESRRGTDVGPKDVERLLDRDDSSFLPEDGPYLRVDSS